MLPRQVLGRRAFTLVNGKPIATGGLVPPEATERGWKDTVVAKSGVLLRLDSKC